MPSESSPTSIAALRQRYGERFRWLFLIAVMVGTMASVMSSTIINVAIPDLSHHFTLGQERAQWVTSGFMVAMTVSMLTTPWLLSRFGYRRTYVGCMALLLFGGVLGGFAQAFPLVLLARVLEGLAAGVVQPIAAIIIMRAFEPHEQGRASGFFTMGVVLAPAIGPSVGGLLVDWFGWRSIFFMVVPFCLIAFWLARKYVPTTGPGDALAVHSGPRLDWGGLVLATAGTLCLLNGLVELHSDGLASAAALLAGAVLSLCGFVAWQHHLAKRGLTRVEPLAPLMNFELFRYRQYAMGSLVGFIYGAALFGSTYLLPVFMLRGLNLSASLVGTIMLPSGIVLAITIAFVGRLADRNPPRILVGMGLFLLSASFALMLTVPVAAPMMLLITWAVLGRIGLGFILPSLNLGAMRGMERGLIAQGASVINFIRMLGGAIGVSLCGIVLEWRLAARGDSLTIEATSPARISAFNETFLMLALLCGLAILASLQLRERRASTSREQ